MNIVLFFLPLVATESCRLEFSAVYVQRGGWKKLGARHTKYFDQWELCRKIHVWYSHIGDMDMKQMIKYNLKKCLSLPS